MQRYNDNILARSGGYVIPAAGASVTVKNYPAGTVATIYSDDGVTPKTNPIVTGSEGEFFFYAADGRYSLDISGGGYTGGSVVDITMEGVPAISDVFASGSLTARTTVGTQSVSGLGFRPSKIEFFSVASSSAQASTSYGIFNGAASIGTYSSSDGTNAASGSVNFAVSIKTPGASDFSVASVATDADGFTLTFVVAGSSPAVTVLWKAYP